MQGKPVYRVDGSKHNCPELQADKLTDRQPVQLPLQLSGTGTTWKLSDHTGEQVLYMLKAVEIELGGAVEQAVAVVKTCTNDTHCSRLGSIECQSWTTVAQGTDMKVAGTDTCRSMESAWSSTMPRSLTVSENWSHLNTSSSNRTSQSGCCSEYHHFCLRWV